MASVSMASTSSPSRIARMMTQSGTANDTSGVPHNTRVPIYSTNSIIELCLCRRWYIYVSHKHSLCLFP